MLYWGVSLCTKSSEGGAGNSYPSRQATIKFVLDMRAWRGKNRDTEGRREEDRKEKEKEEEWEGGGERRGRQ